MIPTVLCVDDENSILDALERALKNYFKVLKCSHPQNALEMLRLHPEINVVLSDQRMPHLSGLEFLEQVRSQYPKLARALLSGQVELEEISSAINKGLVHKFLLKPWENDQLIVQMLEAFQLHNIQTDSLTDPLTGLHNHRFFQDSLKQKIKDSDTSGKSFSLVMMDVDHFKSFNDQFGHLEGDRLLKSVSLLLQSALPSDFELCRYGGEEFGLIVPGKNLAETLVVAERLRRLFEAGAKGSTGAHGAGVAVSIAGAKPIPVTLSFGVSTYPIHGQSPSGLILAADKALYEAKRLGRNQVVAAKDTKDL